MGEREWLAGRFEEHRPRLRAVAYRMLGSLSEADDAVQETWLRLSRSDADEIENLGGWLTTVTGRVALDMLRSRATRREEPLGVRLPDPIIDRADGTDPEHEALLADSVGLALLVVLETLKPAERLAFVLHDMFAVPFDEIARILDRSPDAARQLASRGRRRVQGEHVVPDADVDTQRQVVDAFLAASRDGDFEALLALLDPDVVLHADTGKRDDGAAGGRGGPRPGPDVLPARPGHAPGARQRGRGSGCDARRRAVLARCHHRSRRQDRRDGLPRRPGADARARPHRARRLTPGLLRVRRGPPPTAGGLALARGGLGAAHAAGRAFGDALELGQVLRVASPEVDPPALERDAPRRVIRLRAQLGEARLGRGLHEVNATPLRRPDHPDRMTTARGWA